MNLYESIIAELQHEAPTTRKMLERLPSVSLAWKPHEKSRTLGEVASHIANIPGLFIASLDADQLDRYSYEAAPVDDLSAILSTFDTNITNAFSILPSLSNERMFGSWRYTYGDKTIFELPRIAVIRGMALNHSIHHRGQLSVYMRLLDIPLPPVYGPTADEQM